MTIIASQALRPELPSPPQRIARLPVHRGYPVPFFVAWLDSGGQPVERGEGEPDFRVLAPGSAALCHQRELCWVCGQRRGAYLAFVVGPVSAFTRATPEPPSHRDCADWSVRACPFLARPHMRRREAGMPDVEAPAGAIHTANHGVSAVWVTRRYELEAEGAFRIGEPEPGGLAWYREGRTATQSELLEALQVAVRSLTAAAHTPADFAQLRRMSTGVVGVLTLGGYTADPP